MADPVNFPKDWIDVLSALLTPTIALAGIGLSWLQWKLSRERYKHELFDKRWTIFLAIRDYMGEARTKRKVSEESNIAFLTATRGCRFLFNDEIDALVDETYGKVLRLNLLREDLGSESRGLNRKRHLECLSELNDWLESEIKNLEKRFEKFLQL